MAPTYKKIHIIGTSHTGFEDAVQDAITTAGKTVRNIQWFEVKETRGRVENGAVETWQVDMEIAFKVDN